MKMNEPQHLLKVGNRLGETPIWSPEENALYWVDWGGKPTCRFNPRDTHFSTFPGEVPVTALARRASGGLIAVALNGIYGWDPKRDEYDLICGPAEVDKPEICFNDAAVDRQGRLLVGTVDMDDPFRPVGSLFRLDVDGSLHKIDEGYATANGIGISPDGETVYVADQRHHKIMVMEYDTVNGMVANRRLFAALAEADGMPDGIIVDAEGFIWNGHWAGWKLTRYDPNGRIERQIHFPVENVISFAFGGKNLDELFVTTAFWGFDEEKHKQQPWAGDLFHLRTDVQGLLEPAFAG